MLNIEITEGLLWLGLIISACGSTNKWLRKPVIHIFDR